MSDRRPLLMFICAIACLTSASALAAPAKSAAPAAVAPAAVPQGNYDATLAAKLGADERGMRRYTLAILKTGPTRVPDGPERDAMFKGHFANIQRLADEGKLALAGPFDGVDGWRGMYLFATADLALAKSWIEADPVIVHGEMVAEFHGYYGSAALMLVVPAHTKLVKPKP